MFKHIPIIVGPLRSSDRVAIRRADTIIDQPLFQIAQTIVEQPSQKRLRVLDESFVLRLNVYSSSCLNIF